LVVITDQFCLRIETLIPTQIVIIKAAQIRHHPRATRTLQ
jgi:hypothetical protein